jgi:hypothetical protein
MVDDIDRSSDIAVEDVDGDKKPTASVNKIGAPMGASLKRSSGSKLAKKELHFRDSSLSGSIANSAALETTMAHSHKSIAATLNLEEQIAVVQMQYTMYQGVGDLLHDFASPEWNP